MDDDGFLKLTEESNSFSLPQKFERFLVPRPPDMSDEQSLHFYAFSYERAFEQLAERASERWPGGGLLQLPLFYLARHSIELHIKWVIDEFGKYTGEAGLTSGHDLLALWREMQRQFVIAGMPAEEEWGEHCERLIRHMHQMDPTGEMFRYPHDRKGKPFQYTYVEFKGLEKAHHNVTLYCGASLDVLSEYRPY
ncbi:hypothetical protein [Tardiphaga robiniae]|uniref:HEPN domain-containing protein n=1 Tax=Tardiphaga robiniae TaxID=943830 RepID=A0A7G6TXB2_9BRAD|nr:hypothetical protein [Tardiphaga robiniae]QND71394.1 hypothetical protein HB776_09190 [Tardiphaga robiniae]